MIRTIQLNMNGFKIIASQQYDEFERGPEYFTYQWHISKGNHVVLVGSGSGGYELGPRDLENIYIRSKHQLNSFKANKPMSYLRYSK